MRLIIMRSTAKYRLSVVVILVTAIVLAGQIRPEERTHSEDVFNELASLVGTWEAIQDGVPIKETYTLIANRSTLMAQTQPGDESVMITMFTVDGDRLIATHYCSDRNQPHMVTAIPSDLENGVTFSLERVMGMKTPDDWHNTGLTIKLDDKDHMTQRWTYLHKGKTGTNVFHYTRKK